MILGLDDYAEASYVEGIVALAEVGILIEHGWVCRSDGTVIDPTLPTGVDAYFPGLEFPLHFPETDVCPRAADLR